MSGNKKLRPDFASDGQKPKKTTKLRFDKFCSNIKNYLDLFFSQNEI